MTDMDLTVRAARPQDDAAALLYESARPYYDAYAGSEARALSLLAAVFPRTGHAASYELCRVAIADGPAPYACGVGGNGLASS